MYSRDSHQQHLCVRRTGVLGDSVGRRRDRKELGWSWDYNIASLQTESKITQADIGQNVFCQVACSGGLCGYHLGICSAQFKASGRAVRLFQRLGF